MKRGDIVYDKADCRHVGMIRHINHHRNGSFATIRWLESGWLSDRVPLGDLRHVRDVNNAPMSMRIYYGGW